MLQGGRKGTENRLIWIRTKEENLHHYWADEQHFHHPEVLVFIQCL